MNVKNPTIWVNLTTSVNWQRPPVGIVRVEQSLAKELAKLYGENLKYCIWDNNKFVEYIPSKQEENLVKDKKIEVITNNTELEPMFPILPKRKALANMAQAILSLLPYKLRNYFNQLLFSLKPYIIRGLEKRILKKNISNSSMQHNKSFKSEGDLADSNIFFSGDVLVSVGLDWDYSYYKEFYFLRKDKGLKIVTCCYDLIPVLFPQYCVGNVAGIFTSYFLEIADSSDLILCISKQSQKDLKLMLENTGGANPTTEVFVLGDSVIGVENSNDEISKFIDDLIQEPFILFVSTIERRKNHDVLYKAYHELSKKGKAEELPKLVFVGMQGWGVNDLLKDIELDPLIQGLIVRLNHVSDIELKKLYEKSKFCVFPSLYEGWGLPVAEALSMGKLVLCSNRGSLPEVGGDLVIYIDPWDSVAWATEIYRMATDVAWREQCEEKVKLGYRPRTWSETALSVKSQIDKLIVS